jgi:uncharacterized membrane protein YuzA (DUF378 family)
MSTVKTIALWLLIIGGLAWGVEGLFDRDVFAMIAGNNHPIEIVIDLLVAVSALVIGYDAVTRRA